MAVQQRTTWEMTRNEDGLISGVGQLPEAFDFDGGLVGATAWYDGNVATATVDWKARVGQTLAIDNASNPTVARKPFPATDSTKAVEFIGTGFYETLDEIEIDADAAAERESGLRQREQASPRGRGRKSSTRPKKLKKTVARLYS